MKASKSAQEKLLALQALDSSLIQLEHKANNLPVAKILDEKTIAHAGSSEWTQPREWAGDVTSMAVPPLVVKDFNMSTVSPGS